MPTRKILILMCFLLVGFSALAQTNIAVTPFVETGPAYPEPSNIVYAMVRQVLNNPASLFIIGLLMVIAWLADDLPFINSKYVAHIIVIIGASSYWLFASPASVPKSFPHPAVALAGNGIVCGFIAFVFHRVAIARAINYVRSKSGGTAFLSKPPT